jgi:hypothetical protein
MVEHVDHGNYVKSATGPGILFAHAFEPEAPAGMTLRHLLRALNRHRRRVKSEALDAEVKGMKQSKEESASASHVQHT